MKKLFTFVAALMAVVAINATQVVLNPANMPQLTSAGAYDQTIEGVRVQISNGIVNTSQIRVYKNQTITFTCESPISAIEFTCTATGDSQYGPGCFAEQDGYSYELNKGVWDGSATSVAFTASSNQVRATQIVVYLNGEKPSGEETPVDTIGVTEARARINAGNKGACYIKGVVAGDPFLLGANGPAFYLTDIANPADSLEGFKIAKDALGTAFADVDDMAATLSAGDTILIFALGLDLYNGTVYETISGYFAAMLGKSAAIILDWAVGNAYRETGKWALEIEKVAGNAQNVARLVFNSAVEDGIAGFHQLEAESALTVNGANIAIASGSVTLTFKEINTNGYNVYDVKMVAQAGDDMYRINRDIEFYAQNGDGDEIVLIGDRPFVPKDGDTITCAQAKEYTLTLGSGESSTATVTVRGFVTDMFSNGVTFWMDDKKGSAKTIQAYSCTMPLGVNVVNDTEVFVTGKLKNYNGTAEIDHGTVTVISGAEAVTVVEVTVSEAVAACQALEQNKVSAETYAITGYITEIAYEYSAEYGNISFWMSDNLNDNGQVFQAYRAKCEASIADKLVPGAKVKVTDKLKHFHQDATEGENPKPERTVYETNGGGTVELISGAGVEDIFTNAPAVKVLENGQIYIIRGGVRYNLQGQIAE